jgi:hypothetical protein
MAFIVSWEFFLFVVMRDAAGLSTAAARTHIWLALAAGISACVASGLTFRFFSRYEKNKWSKVVLTPTGPPPITLGGNTFIKAAAPIPFGRKRWWLANAWLAEGQADDRTQMDGSVTGSGETSSGQRAIARQTHQLMFKKWSQARHD